MVRKFPGTQRLSGLLLAAIFSTAAPLTGARAACGDSDHVQCHAEFEALDVVVPQDDGFAAAGQIQKGTSTGLAFLHIARDGSAGQAIGLPWLGDVADNQTMVALPSKMIATPNGDLILLGQLRFVDETRTIGWAMRISNNRRVLWNKTFADPNSSVIVYSGFYDVKNDRIIMVGRLTVGGDCQMWSQSLVITLRGSDGKETAPRLTAGEQAAKPTNRQALFDIAPGDLPNSYLVAGFATTADSRSEHKCDDNVLVGRLTWTNGRWTLTPLRRLGAKDTNEDTFAISEVARGTYLLAGYHIDSPTDANAAQAYLIKTTPLTVSSPLNELRVSAALADAETRLD